MRISDWSSDVCSSDLIDVAGSEPHRQATADHQEQFVLMLVVVPVELAGEFRELHECVIEFARDLRAPVIAEATERLAKIDFVHVGSLAYSVHENVRVPIRSSEARRVGTVSVSTCRLRWPAVLQKKKIATH